nr:hypothetical protein [Tanacetum cinerariifolium]
FKKLAKDQTMSHAYKMKLEKKYTSMEKILNKYRVVQMKAKK